ncbi:MAG: hypothetical protein AAGA58_15245 [Verrucomicrobiota bacterium]
MPRCFITIFLLLISVAVSRSDSSKASNPFDLDHPAHNYWERPLTDTFSQLVPDLNSGKVPLDRSGDLRFLESLLEILDIPVESQLKVFSTTSLQLRYISPRTPRAIYFNEETSVGYIPGGRIEVISLDPQAGAIFHIFDIPRDDGPIRFERSNRCMNCHADLETRNIPGLLIKSSLPGPTGGTLRSFRDNRHGHDIPFEERFAGWHVTGEHHIKNHQGNAIGKMWKGELSKEEFLPGDKSDLNQYPVPTSDILPHLLFEHKAGFTNRVLEATYLARFYEHTSKANFTSSQNQKLDDIADGLVRYILFADEVPLPRGGVEGQQEYIDAFRENRRSTKDGRSLKDFDLETRLFRYRCSYMIYTPLFREMPEAIRARILKKLTTALADDAPSEFRYLPLSERRAIRQIIAETY